MCWGLGVDADGLKTLSHTALVVTTARSVR